MVADEVQRENRASGATFDLEERTAVFGESVLSSVNDFQNCGNEATYQPVGTFFNEYWCELLRGG